MLGIHLPVYALLHHPGYTLPYYRPAHHWVHCSTAATVQDDDTLGSKEEKPVGGRLSGASGLPFLLGLLGDDAQSCLLSPVNKVERLDSDRAFPYCISYDMVMWRIVVSVPCSIRSLLMVHNEARTIGHLCAESSS